MKTLTLLIVRSGIASALILAVGCQKKTETQFSASLPVVPVRVEMVTPKAYQATEDVVGSVRAKLRASIEAKLNGRIEAMPILLGQAVKKGDLLAQLDPRETQARLDQAKAVYKQAELDHKRFTVLLEQKTIAPQEFEAVQARFQVAAAAVSEAETMLSHTKIIAPFDGVISRKLADVGDFALPGKTLMELEDPSQLQFEANVPEALINQVRLGGKMSVRVTALTNALAGTVCELAPIADPNSRTSLVKLDLPSAAGLRSGLFGRLAVPTVEAMTLRVPAGAVVRRGQMEMVFVVADQQAHLRLVKTGKRIGADFEIVSGLNPGERIIIDNVTDLLDGQPVEVKP